MTNKIQEDKKRFRDVISGRARKALKKYTDSKAIVRLKPKHGKVVLSIPQIHTPHFLHGDNGSGIGRGPGKEGDIIDQKPSPGGSGNEPGDEAGDGLLIQFDLEEVLKFMENELNLPRMKPKPSETFEEVKYKYTNVSKVGLNSLRHVRRTMKEAIKRLAMTKNLDQPRPTSGSEVPIRVISPIKSDFRYRQYKEIKIPSSNAVIFFARDFSGSMDDYRCDIVSDMSWWIDCWIKRFYDKVDHCYFVHDVEAREVSEQDFYRLRGGGGTKCSSAFDIIAHQLENRYPPQKYNIYVFYFTDGENIGGDNEKIANIINERLGPNAVNMVGITEVCGDSRNGVKGFIDNKIKSGALTEGHVKTVSVSEGGKLEEEARNGQILDGIRKILSESKTT